MIAVEVVIDVQHSASALPDWWQLGNGGCREGSLLFTSESPLDAACEDFWMGLGTDRERAAYFVMEPRGGANQARIHFGVALPSDQARALNAADLYYAARLELRNGLTLNCPGCLQPACLVLNSILIGRLPGAEGGDLLLTVPGPGEGNWVKWQGDGADCSAVPVRSTTWGQVKSFYR